MKTLSLSTLLSISLFFSSFVMANGINPTSQEKTRQVSNEVYEYATKPNQTKEKVECSTEVNGVTYTATGRARTIEHATDRCVEKLAKIVAHVQGVPLPEKVD